ncbi:MAG: RagB/SusD family nutrient uptake outer membrane protein [Prevotellaceae bacterium]|nr:RagB/SusD family nutrient uptake outer membrane protein [Prevotellaceae bacterium]
MKKFLLLILLAALSVACEDYLNKEPYSYTSAGFFKTEEAIELGLTGVYYNMYLDSYNFGYMVPNYVFLDQFTGMAFERNDAPPTIGAGGALDQNNTRVLQWWRTWYTFIARTNSLIYGSKDYIAGLSDKARQYIAEARVLRAFAYYNLIATYGDAPFFDEPVTVEQYRTPRTSKAIILDFILNETAEAARYLEWTAAVRGRMDKAAAYGLRARAALLGGSLNYGGRAEDYFRIAAAAADTVIGRRQLANRYDDLFTTTGQAKADARSELIIEVMYSHDGTKRTHLIGFGSASRFYGQTLRHPSSLLADTYECIDGKRIDESPLYDPKHPQRNRDPRFHATLRMHGDTCVGNTTGTDEGKIKIILNAYDDNTLQYDYNARTWKTVTNMDLNSSAAWTSFAVMGAGYIWHKMAGDSVESIQASTIHYPVMRYAELLLTYAEAKIELNALDQSVYDAINEVRRRAGMPDVSSDRIGSVDKMRQLVRRERKVELALEGLHFVDMRRWGIGDLENEHDSYGVPLKETGGYEGITEKPNFKTTPRHDLNDIANYEAYKHKLRVAVPGRFWETKFELWPIPQQEIFLNPALEQNAEYSN